MTVSSQYTPIVYVGDGIQRQWPVSFRVFSPSEVRAGLAGEYGLITPLEYGADYTVTLNAGGLGGTVSLLVPAGEKLALWLETAIVQEDHLTPTGPLDAESLMFELDRGAIIDQQLAEGLARAVKAPTGSGKTGDEYALELFTARDEAEASARRAENESGRASVEADRSSEELNKIQDLLDAARLSSLSRNLRATLVVGAATASGATLTLPVPYYPGRDILFLSYNGVVCTPRKEGVAAAGMYQYEEVGGGLNEFSDKVKIYFAAAKGAVFDVWVVASNLIREMEKLEAMAASAETNAVDAVASAAAAQAAQNASETARTAAQTSQMAAESARSAAAASASNAASSSVSAAGSASAAAIDASKALASANGAAVSASNASTFSGNAYIRATEAANSATLADIARTAAETAQSFAEAARNSSMENAERVALALPAIIAEGDSQTDRVAAEGNSHTAAIIAEGDRHMAAITSEGNSQTALVKAEGDRQALRLASAIEAALATAAQLTEVLARVAHMELHITGLENEIAELKAAQCGG